jgi:hypothetical protein
MTVIVIDQRHAELRCVRKCSTQAPRRNWILYMHCLYSVFVVSTWLQFEKGFVGHCRRVYMISDTWLFLCVFIEAINQCLTNGMLLCFADINWMEVQIYCNTTWTFRKRFILRFERAIIRLYMDIKTKRRQIGFITDVILGHVVCFDLRKWNKHVAVCSSFFFLIAVLRHGFVILAIVLFHLIFFSSEQVSFGAIWLSEWLNVSACTLHLLSLVSLSVS